jgi:two-component system, OmpR family, sensor histidine kinase ChvG
MLSTQGGDIDAIVKAERYAIFRVFAVAAMVTAILSLLLASTIANPLRRLSAAAVRVRRSVKNREEIPDFSDRQDEIGNLSVALREMTNALYARIEAIESFAADVSHELKNPLTSLRSAVETLPLAKNEESRERLLEVIQHDVRRLDRLITDISDASRLDAELVREDAELVDLKKLVGEIATMSSDAGHHHKPVKVEFKVARDAAGDRGFQVQGHDLRLGQVVTNLIENARSFVPDREAASSSRCRVRPGDTVIVTVDDNGPGIRVEKIERIFERFYTDRPASEAFGQNSGTGPLDQPADRRGPWRHADGGEHPGTKPGEVRGARFVVTLPAEK